MRKENTRRLEPQYMERYDNNTPSQSTLLGAAGQHFVLCQLLRHGLIAALAPEGAPNTDIIVTDIKAKMQCAIQVKTRSGKGSDKGWHMREKHENISSKSYFYCFVDFGEESPITYIIPSSVVAKKIKASHVIWLKLRGKRGRKHHETAMRRLLPDYTKTLKKATAEVTKIGLGAGWMEQYRENWKILRLK